MPVYSKVKSNNGISGLALVSSVGENLRVMFQEDGRTIETFSVARNGWRREDGLYKITLNKTNDVIKFVAPAGRSEPFLVRFKEFANRLGRDDNNPGVPQPKMKGAETRHFKTGGSKYIPAHPVFGAWLEIVEQGLYEGLTIYYEMPYIFELYPNSTSTMFNGTRGENERIENFLTTAGMDLVQEDIPFSDNVLPYIEMRLQQLNRVFSVQLTDRGYVAKDGLRSIASWAIPDYLREDAKPAKAKAKKPAAKKPAAKKAARKSK